MSSSNRIRVMLVDDHPIVRRGLRDVLEDSGAFDVVGQAADGVEAVRTAEELRPDVIVMDVMMPKKDGVEACRDILDLLPDAKVLMLTASTEDDAVIEAIAAGATGFVQKYSGSDELVDTPPAGGGGAIDDSGGRSEAGLQAVTRRNCTDARAEGTDGKGTGGPHALRPGQAICANSRCPESQHGDGQERHLSHTEQAWGRVQAGDRRVGRAKRTAGWGGGGYPANAVKGWLGKRMAETFQTAS